MAAKEKKNRMKAQTEGENAAPAEEKTAALEDFPDELREAIWAVISFEKCEASGLTYAQAERKLSELEAQNISGLCIVTDEVAARIVDKR
jgi:hypothetical protein